MNLEAWFYNVANPSNGRVDSVMKKLFALLVSLVLVVSFFSSAFAENILAADVDDIVDMIEYSVADDFAYCNVIYNQKDNLLIVDFAIDGFAQYITELKQNGGSKYSEDWVLFKDAISYMYSTLQETISLVGRDDLKDILVLRLVNDDVVLRCDYSTISYSPFLIIRKGILVEDVMAR